MSVNICLLITDDPDDQQAFSEVLSDYEDTIILVVLESKKAVRLLEAKIYSPDYIFVDLSMHGIKINAFLKFIKNDESIASVPVVVYGDDENFGKIGNTEGWIFFRKDYEYSELKKFLLELIKPSKGMS